MTPETEQQYKNQIAALQAEIEKLKNQQTKAIQREKYGLNWIDVPEEFDEKSKNSIPVLIEDKNKAIKNADGKPTHILIEGDNYHALTCLNYTHAGKIDVIYIDPPYNTGSDGFTYKDARFMTEFPNGKPVPKDDPLRHSTWLSFMEKRLRLAKNLLSDKGVIFISINEDEYCQLKLLCDEIFGANNYITSFTIKVRHEDRILKGDKPIHETTEQLLLFQKSSSFKINKRIKDNSSDSEYVFQIKEIIDNPKIITMGNKQVEVFYPGEYEEIKTLPSFNNLKKINIRGSIKAGNSSGRFHMKYLEPLKDNFNVLYKVPDMGDDGLGYRYFISRKNEKQSNGSYYQGCPINRQDEIEIPYPNFFDFEEEFNTVGTEGGVPFDGGKKPIAFISNFLKIAFGNKNINVLDFFAGSGSTLHAIISRNDTSQCILVQEPQKTYEMKNEKKMELKGCENVFNAGYESIIDVTWQRCKNVMQGYTNAKGEEIAGLGNSLKYYKTDFIGKNKPEKATDEDRISLAQKAGYLISLVENTLEEIETNDFYQIFSDAEENQFTAIYFNGDTEKFPDFVQSIQEKNKKTIVYIFTWGSPDIFENEFDDLTNITIKSIPQPILEIYKSLMKNEE